MHAYLLPKSTGASGSDDWRLELASVLGIEVLAYLRSTDGFLTTMHDVVERGLIGHRVATFTPGGTGTRSACCG